MTKTIAEKIEANLEEVKTPALAGGQFYTSTERQGNYIARQLDRCIRCGDHVHFLVRFHTPLLLCGSCREALEAHDDFVWFASALAKSGSH